MGHAMGCSLGAGGIVQPDSGGGGGDTIDIVATWGDLPLSPADGDRVFIESKRASFTFFDLAGGKWLPDLLIRDSAGALRTVAVGKDTEAVPNDLYVYAGGPTFPASWTSDGVNSVDADAVRIGRYVFTPVASTSPYVLVMLELASPPPAGTSPTTNVGVLGGSVRGGVDRIAGVLLQGSTDPCPLNIGRFGTPAGLAGQAQGGTGEPIYVWLDLTGADANCRVCDQGGPSFGVESERAALSLATAWFELMNMDAASNPMATPLELLYAVAFDVT